MEKHHKILIGGVSSAIIIILVIYGILLNGIIVKQTINHNELKAELEDSQNQINELTTTLLETKEKISVLDTQVGSIDKEFSSLKASVSSDFSSVVEDTIKSVVTIKTNSGQGTGFIINNEGYIVTNAHVLSNDQGYLAENIRAVTYDGETLSAEFIGFDNEFDLALLKITGDYEPLILANSDEVQVAEKVIAIGNPYGLSFSVSEGIVSQQNVEGPNGIEVYIQTTAALNSGNSGGPLINTDGEVIGINTFKLINGEALGFALESNYIKDIINTIAQEQLNQTLIK